MVIVPPDRSAGDARPARAVSASPPSALGQPGQAQRVRALDVRHDQPALGRGGDAQVHVVLDHDLLRVLVPGRVDHRVPGHRDQQRPGHQQQRRHPDPGELRQLPQPPDRVDRGADVGLQELGHVRGPPRALGDRGRGVLADAADGDPLLPGTRRGRLGQRSEHRGVQRAGGLLHVVAADGPARPGAGQPGQVHPELPGQLADRRLRQHARVAARPAVRAGWRQGIRNGTTSRRCLPPGHRGRGRRGGSLTRAPGGRAGLDAVADQDGLPLRRRGDRRHQVLGGGTRSRRRDGGRVDGGASRAGRQGGAGPGGWRRGTRPGAAARRAGHVHRDDGRAHVHGLALGHQQRGHHARVRAGQLDDGLGRLDVHHDLVHDHRVARLHPPADDVRLGQPFAHVRKAELTAHGGRRCCGRRSCGRRLGHDQPSQTAKVRLTASSTRSRSGR